MATPVCTISRVKDAVDVDGKRQIEWLIRSRDRRLTDRQIAAALAELAELPVRDFVVSQHRRGRCACPIPEEWQS